MSFDNFQNVISSQKISVTKNTIEYNLLINRIHIIFLIIKMY